MLHSSLALWLWQVQNFDKSNQFLSLGGGGHGE